MSIRSLIKTSNLAQLGLLLLLGLCFFWLGRSLQNVNSMLHSFYRLEALLSEVDAHASDKYRLALDYIISGDGTSFEEWRKILRVERGELSRPATAHFAPLERRSFRELAADLKLDPSAREPLDAILEQNEQLNRMTERAVMRSDGLYPDAGGAFTVQGPAQPQEALRWTYDVRLARVPERILESTRKLRGKLYHEFLELLPERQRTLGWMLGPAVIGLALLVCTVAVNMLVFRRRVITPLILVGRYAEGVAAGQNPPTLRLRYKDELAGMFDSLQKMKGTLFERIRDLKQAERAERKSRHQAVMARSQALTSLELAQRASRVQEEFLRRISHEIRTPMNAIIGMSYLCLQTDLSGVQRNYLAQINKSGSVLLDMVNRILDFSSANEGSMRVERAAFSLPHFLELLRQSVAGSALEKKLAFTVDLDPGLPSLVVGDERHLEEVLRILLDNAVKYTCRGAVELAVTVVDAALPDGRLRVRFTVSDTGPGISAEERKRLFEPFTPGDESMTRSRSGLGLGLALARQLVTLMGGGLAVESEPGRGSRLSFDLELEVAPQPATEALAQATDDSGTEPGGQKREARVVLVVDDNEINRQIAKELLEQAGVEVRLAADGQEAVEQAGSADVALVFMDVQMPVMDGMEATRRIRGLGRGPGDLPILAMTAHTDAASRMDGMGVGMNDYLTKPVDPAALYAALEKWLPGGLGHNPMEDGAPADGHAAAPQARQEMSSAAGGRLPVNLEAGLATVGGNEKLYNELLLRFVEHYGNSAAQLRNLLSEGDYRGAARLAHTVKGVAANLGVERITELTRRMEASLPGVPPDEDLLRKFELTMDEALEQIRALQSHRRTATTGTLLMAEHERERLCELLEELPQRMETDWGSVESALEEFTPLVEGTPYAGDLAAILAAVNDFDPAAMAARAAGLRDKLAQERPPSGKS